MLLAVMDLGSNSFKMTVAQWAPDLSRRKPFEVLHKERHPIQLGASVFAEGKISKDDFKKAMSALRKMQARLRDFASPILRVVATSAIRDAENGAAFVETARRELGLGIEVITGRHEAALIARGLEIEYPSVGRGLLIDIGGGSTEIATFGRVLSPDAAPNLCRSFKIGSVRLASKFFPDPGSHDLEKARKFARECFKTLPALMGEFGKVEKLVGSAGTIQSLGEILARDGDTGTPLITRARLERWIEDNQSRTPKELEKTCSLRPSRARVIVPGAVILSEVLAILGQDAIRVTGMTLRDGLMVDLVENWQRPREQIGPDTAAERQKGSGLTKGFLEEIETAALRFPIPLASARHVAFLANGFCQQLRKNLGDGASEGDFRTLTAAAYFYYSGRAVNEEGFERHSAYILEHARLPHLNDRERKSAARMIQNARSNGNGADNQRQSKLMAIFRLALELDEIESQNILAADVKIKDGQALVRLIQRGAGHAADVASVREVFKLFENAFDLKIVTFVDHHPAG